MLTQDRRFASFAVLALLLGCCGASLAETNTYPVQKVTTEVSTLNSRLRYQRLGDEVVLDVISSTGTRRLGSFSAKDSYGLDSPLRELRPLGPNKAWILTDSERFGQALVVDLDDTTVSERYHGKMLQLSPDDDHLAYKFQIGHTIQAVFTDNVMIYPDIIAGSESDPDAGWRTASGRLLTYDAGVRLPPGVERTVVLGLAWITATSLQVVVEETTTNSSTRLLLLDAYVPKHRPLGPTDVRISTTTIATREADAIRKRIRQFER